MEKYYKTNRNSKTGLKLKAILDKVEEFDKQISELSKKYGFSEIAHSQYFLKSLDAVIFEENPDKTIWKKVKDVYNGYYPRTRCKNKELIDDFDKVNKLRIRRIELDKIIGNNRVFCHAGFNVDIPNVYIFIVESDWNCDIPQDCQEISNIEYEKLISNKESYDKK